MIGESDFEEDPVLTGLKTSIFNTAEGASFSNFTIDNAGVTMTIKKSHGFAILVENALASNFLNINVTNSKANTSGVDEVEYAGLLVGRAYNDALLKTFILKIAL